MKNRCLSKATCLESGENHCLSAARADTGWGQSWPAWYHEAQNRLVHRHPEGQSCAILGYGYLWLSSGALLFISPASPTTI